MTPVLIIAISLLGAIMMASLLALLLLLCTKRRCRKAHLAQTQYKEQDAELVKATWNKSHGELGLGGYSPEDDLPDMFLDPDWNGDAENVISDCIKLLKSCHVLTEQLVAYTMENGGMIKSPMEVNNIVTAAKNIRPRVDELVKAMYTPSNSKQIEEKSTALYKSVCKLLQVVQGASKKPDTLDWADEIILTIEKHMEAMQSGCQSMCSSCSSIQSSASSVSCLCRQPMVVVTNQAYCYSLNTPVC